MSKRARTISSLATLTMLAAAPACSDHAQTPTIHEATVVATLAASDVTQSVVSENGRRKVFVMTVRVPETSERWVAAEWSPSLVGDADRDAIVYALPGAMCLDPRHDENGIPYCGDVPLEGEPREALEIVELRPSWSQHPMLLPRTERTHITIAGIVDSVGPKHFVFRRVPSNPSEPSITVATLDVELSAPQDDGIALRAFGQVQGAMLESNPTGVGRYLAGSSLYIYGLDAPRTPAETTSMLRVPDVSGTLALFSGASTMRDALALRAIWGSLDTDEPREIPIARLLGPAGGDLPFATWLGASNPTVEASSALVPHDAWFLHFTSFGKFLELLDVAEDWGTDLLHAIEPRARDFALRARYQEMLGLELTAIARLFGDRVIDDVTLTGHDTFFRDGSDLTMILHLSAPAPARAHLTRTLDRVGERHGATKSTTTLAGASVEVRRSSNGRVRSHAAFVEDWAIVSTSAVALERVLETRAGRRPSLARTADYRWLRTQMPSGESNEDGLLYLSDDFVRSVVSPAVQIADKRRVLCAGHLALLGFAALAHHRDRGTSATIEELVARRYLGAHDLSCPDEGAYSVSDDVPRCSVHGTPTYLTPTVENPPTRLSETEVGLYQQFADAYDGIFRHAVDPVAVRFRIGEDVEADLLALPLVASSEYQSLRAWLGDAEATFRDDAILPDTLASLSVALLARGANGERNPLIPDALNDPLFEPGGPLDVARWLGDRLTIHVRDDVPLFTVHADILQRLIGGDGADGTARSLLIATAASASTLPVYVSVPIRDRELARRAMDHIVRTLGERNRNYIQTERYVTESHRGEPIRVLSILLGPVHVRLFSAMVGDLLVVATRRDVITDLLDGENELSHEARYTGHARIDVRPDAFVQVREVLEIGWQEELRHACHANLAVYKLVREIYGHAGADDAEHTRNVVGHGVYCPEGGRYAFDEDEGGAHCTVHGRPGRARQGRRLEETSTTSRTLHGIHAVEIGFAFTEQGIRAHLRLGR